jgi:predicted helicase
VQILDPATGTGTFLVEVIDVIYRTLREKWDRAGKSEGEKRQLWNEYVPRYLLPRLHGFELIMAPYAIAHMKIGLKLAETKYAFLSSERARVYLTNTLEEPKNFSDYFEQMAPALAHEAEAANRVKRSAPITIVIGNPPYSNLSANLTEEARLLIRPYKFIEGERIYERGALSLEKNLNDDYVKFFRYSEVKLEAGVSSLITNNGFIANPTLRGMRWNLLQKFTSLHIMNLLGYAGSSTRVPQGVQDENVFEKSQMRG